MITIVLPVYNEELVLKQNTLKLLNFCSKNIKSPWQIVISNNSSGDKTNIIAQELSSQYHQIKYFYTNNQGKGYGVIMAWQKFPAQIYIYMDIDLSTSLEHLPELIQAIEQNYDIATGSRLIKGAQVERSLSRKIISLSLRLILKILFNLKTKDAPCGFKAANQKTIDQIIPQIQNKTWFFDTEMIILAEKKEYKIKQIPINWQEKKHPERQSKVGVATVIKDYIKNIYKIYVRK